MKPVRRFWHRRSLLQPQVWPLAIAVLGLVYFYLASGRISSAKPAVDLPTSSGSGCGPQPFYDITIDKDGRIFFGAADQEGREWQAALIENVAAQQGIRFDDQQKHQLQNLPYLGTDLRNLPTYFSLPSGERHRMMNTGMPFQIGKAQLLDLVRAAQSIHTPSGRRSLYAIRADKQTAYYQVKNVMNIMQQCGIHQFTLRTSRE